jgi:hypothetical protein
MERRVARESKRRRRSRADEIITTRVRVFIRARVDFRKVTPGSRRRYALATANELYFAQARCICCCYVTRQWSRP